MKICILIEDKPDGGVRSHVVRQAVGKETIADETGANQIALELERQLDDIMAESRRLYAERAAQEQDARPKVLVESVTLNKEPWKCLH